MDKATLPTNFKDDVLASAMGGKRRYNMIHNSDGTVSFEDVTNYTQVGSTFGAAQINATNEAVNNAADASKIIDSLETIKANTQSGYIAGALAVKALSSNLGEVYYLGTSTSYNLATLLPNIDYAKLTADNFIVSVNSMPSVRTNTWTNGECHPYARATGLSVSKSYNKDTGKLSISASQRIYATNGDNNSDVAHVDQSCSFKVYLVTGSIKSV